MTEFYSIAYISAGVLILVSFLLRYSPPGSSFRFTKKTRHKTRQGPTGPNPTPRNPRQTKSKSKPTSSDQRSPQTKKLETKLLAIDQDLRQGYLDKAASSYRAIKTELEASADRRILNQKENITLGIALAFIKRGDKSLETGMLEVARGSFSQALEFVQDTEYTKYTRFEAVKGIAKTSYEIGRRAEKSKRYGEAVEHYQDAIKHIDQIPVSYSAALCLNCELRIAIVGLKNGLPPNEETIEKLDDEHSRIKSDLLFRYALHCARKGEIEKCAAILSMHFKPSPALLSKALSALRTYTDAYSAQKHIKQAVLPLLIQVGPTIASQDIEKTDALYEAIRKIDLAKVKSAQPGLVGPVELAERCLYRKLVAGDIQREEYEMLQYYLDLAPRKHAPESWISIAAVCLFMASSRQISYQNYKKVVSSYLEALEAVETCRALLQYLADQGSAPGIQPYEFREELLHAFENALLAAGPEGASQAALHLFRKKNKYSDKSDALSSSWSIKNTNPYRLLKVNRDATKKEILLALQQIQRDRSQYSSEEINHARWAHNLLLKPDQRRLIDFMFLEIDDIPFDFDLNAFAAINAKMPDLNSIDENTFDSL
jgi:tetratricopeptide (TPR) repeat protein